MIYNSIIPVCSYSNISLTDNEERIKACCQVVMLDLDNDFKMFDTLVKLINVNKTNYETIEGVLGYYLCKAVVRTSVSHFHNEKIDTILKQQREIIIKKADSVLADFKKKYSKLNGNRSQVNENSKIINKFFTYE